MCAQALFRSVNKLLMDTATAEYLFCCDFFQEDAVFAELFAATLAVVEAALAASLQARGPCCLAVPGGWYTSYLIVVEELLIGAALRAAGDA